MADEQSTPSESPAPMTRRLPRIPLATFDDALIKVRDFSGGYGDLVLMRDVEFDIRRGEVFCVLGGSGCGKSTLLKTMIGLVPPLAGTIEISGADIATSYAEDRAEIQKNIGVMYQQGALFGSMTLLQNVCIPLEEHTNLNKRSREMVARSKLQMVSLGGYEDFLPNEISGGMRKRAAIARAMALDPEILFLDEPSAGLDPVTSADLDSLILRLSRSLGLTFVMVTHELPSIFAVVDRCVMLDKDVKGMVAVGVPKELADNPPHEIVAHFFLREASEALSQAASETAPEAVTEELPPGSTKAP